MTNFQRSVNNLNARGSFVFEKLIVVYPVKLTTLYGIRIFVTEGFEVIMRSVSKFVVQNVTPCSLVGPSAVLSGCLRDECSYGTERDWSPC
jgi:hypothetical protein